MNNKIDHEVRDKITMILGLVEKFKEICENKKTTKRSDKRKSVSIEFDNQAEVHIKTEEGLEAQN